jgi:iron complex outermembrane receptor protein
MHIAERVGLTLGLCALLFALPPSLAQAQTRLADASTSADLEGGALAEVTVTARRSEESIQSVPVSVTAIDAEQLRERSISTPEDLQRSTPGTYLSGSGGRENVVYQIRGQSKALSGPSSPAVVSYFSEVPDVTFGSSVPAYDISSIQVLKGPQGTLFGRNTTGGAILYTPTAPTYAFEGLADETVGNYGDHETQAVVNLPLIDRKLALRISGDLHQRDGYTSNPGAGGNLDDVNTKAVRASLLAEPLPGLKNLSIFDFYKSDYHGDGVNLIAVAPGETLLAQLGLQTAFNQQLALQRARGPFVVDTSPADFTHNRRFGITNRTDFDAGWFQLANIFGFRDTHLSYYINVDGAPAITADGTGAFPAGLALEFIRGSLDNNVRQYSDEIQLKGRALGGKLDWLGGLFYLRNEPSGAQGNFVGFAHIVGTPSAGAGYNFITETSKAVFLHGTYDLGSFLEGLAFEAGARYTRDSVTSCTGTGLADASSGVVQPGDCEGAAANITNSSVNSTSSGAATWSVGMNWQVSQRVFTYVVSRHGYRAGGINSPTLIGRLAPFQSFAPETVTDVEIGLRSDWQLGPTALRLNASAFNGWYHDVQVAVTGVQTSPLCTSTNNGPGLSPTGSCDPNNDPAGGTLLVNLGKTRVSGIDIDGEWALMDSVAITYAANFLDPETVAVSVPSSLTPYVDASGIPFNMTARRTFSGGIRYRFPLPAEWGEMVGNADEYYTSETSFTGTALPAYAVLNVRLDYNNIQGGPVDVGIFVRNATDRRYAQTPVASGAFLGITSAIYGPPRMYGLEFRVRFGK